MQWHPLNSYFTRLLYLIPVRNIFYYTRYSFNSSFTHLLGLIVIRNRFQWVWLFAYASTHISWVLKPSGTNFSEYGSMFTASAYIYRVLRVLRWLATNCNGYGSMRTTSSHILGSLNDQRFFVSNLEQIRIKTCLLILYNLQQALVWEQKMSQENLPYLSLLCSALLS